MNDINWDILRIIRLIQVVAENDKGYVYDSAEIMMKRYGF